MYLLIDSFKHVYKILFIFWWVLGLIQEEGWPLGLRLLNSRVGLVRNGDFSGSVSFSTMLSGSATPSTYSSSDLDTQVCTFLCSRNKNMCVCVCELTTLLVWYSFRFQKDSFFDLLNNWCIWSILSIRYIHYSINLKDEYLFIFKTTRITKLPMLVFAPKLLWLWPFL